MKNDLVSIETPDGSFHVDAELQSSERVFARRGDVGSRGGGDVARVGYGARVVLRVD